MEVYVPYIIGSSVSAFLGKIAYSYFSNDDVTYDDIEDLDINRNDYELINKKGDKEIFWKPLGSTMTQKTKAIRKICKDDCGFTITDKKHHKERARIIYYMDHYENLGHDEFVNRFIKKWKLKEIFNKKN
jgi:hypothetical protein